MAIARTPRQRWVEQGLRALAAGGPDAVRIETLAKALAVSKGGFYWHFKDRSALLDEMLDTWEQRGVDEVISWVDTGGGDAKAKLWRLFSPRSTINEEVSLELAIRDWARRDKSVARRVRRVDNRRMEYLRSLFGTFCPDEEDVEARCMLAMALFMGDQFIVADHGDRSRREVLDAALGRLLS